MSWLFGKKKEEKKKPNSEEAMKAINMQIDNIGKREQVLDVRSKQLVQEALKQKKSKNSRAAILALKKKKLVEQEMHKIGGMKMLLEQQKLQLEGMIHARERDRGGVRRGHLFDSEDGGRGVDGGPEGSGRGAVREAQGGH